MANILEMSRVAPFLSAESPEVNEFSLPLTLFDTFWFKFPPVESVFLYSMAEPKETFLSSVIPRLKHSLSLTLSHFLPLAGTLRWPTNSATPTITYRSPNDAVCVVIAESEADSFDALCGNHFRKASSFRCLVPKLSTSHTGASILSLQVTVFPGKGLSIGVATHHAFVDGKSFSMFIKSWAHLCREVNATSLPPELTPVFDRSLVKDPKGLATLFITQKLNLFKSSEAQAYTDPRDDPELFQFTTTPDIPPNLIRATFVLSQAHIIKLRQDISSPVRLSTFVVALSHALRCLVKSTEICGGNSSKLVLTIPADFRNRIKPPVPENYFGNCVGILMREVIISGPEVASLVKEMITEMERKDDVMEGAEQWLERSTHTHFLGVAGAPSLKLYTVDFGWGSPTKVEIVSIDRTGALSMLDTPCGTGIEIGIVLDNNQMDVFTCLFAEGLLTNL